MDLNEESRRIVHDWAAESGGPEVAAALMASLSPVPPSQLATKTDLEHFGGALRVEMHQLGSELRVEMAGVKVEMAELGSELRVEMAGVKVEMAGVKSEIGELAGQLDARLYRLYAANVASMLGVAALVLGAVRLG